MKFTFDLLPDTQPIFIPPRRMHPTLQASLDQELESLCQLGICNKVNFSNWACAASLVPKADGSYRLVGDYKPINKVTKPLKINFTTIQDALTSLGSASIFSKLDLASGYWQIPVHEDHMDKTTLSSRSGLYQFTVMPLQSFLGMAGVYRHFISKYSIITEPLNRLRRKDEEYVWGPDQATAFAKVKQQLMALPTLRQPDFQHDFELHSDAASKYGIAVILCQRYDNHPYPLAFASRSLSSAEANYSIQELEALAIITLADILYRQFIPRHGLPDEFLSDNGPPFASEFISTLASLLNIQLRLTPPYHQQANGIAERFMGTLRRLILAYIDQPLVGNHWDQLLQLFAFAHNTTHLDIINSTPFFICHGRHARVPLVSSPPSTTSIMEFNPHQYIDNMTSTLDLAYNNIIENYRVYQDSLLTNIPRLTIDSQVLLQQHQHSNARLGRSRKLLYDWVGPFKVIKIRSDTTYDILDTRSTKAHYNVHISRLKTYFPPPG
ncbi:hypothetical protein [Absidia glauca]|uniref:Integrase catalytic domain-containing protein n=2 Tax=Absidia glauca TaxID=4829 RepID=A0A163J0I0_ABSGL|nr:hypothetical protein [Absidia glauca]